MSGFLTVGPSNESPKPKLACINYGFPLTYLHNELEARGWSDRTDSLDQAGSTIGWKAIQDKLRIEAKGRGGVTYAPNEYGHTRVNLRRLPRCLFKGWRRKPVEEEFDRGTSLQHYSDARWLG